MDSMRNWISWVTTCCQATLGDMRISSGSLALEGLMRAFVAREPRSF